MNDSFLVLPRSVQGVVSPLTPLTPLSPPTPLSRRGALAGAVLSASAVALLGGRDALAAGAKGDPANDVRILNTALAAELEAVAAYQVGAESSLLGKPALALAQQFQGHHKEHAEALAGTVSKMGGKPVAKKDKYTFPTDKLKNEADVLRFAAGLERGAVAAYLGAVPVLDDRKLAQVAASILGDEAMHWAVLRNALGETPVPAAFMS
ncbi:MAG: ferritin-like domain-containing protein [Rubrivivax sp.]|nr:ferritin-like domain-containing protein [Rubrivivax sp.]